MKRTPCEYIVWNGLPVIRKGIALSMINDYGLNQRETAEKLGISGAAVCQYLSGKRGRVDIDDTELFKEFNKSAAKIIESGKDVINTETCRLCRIFIQKNIFPINENNKKEKK